MKAIYIYVECIKVTTTIEVLLTIITWIAEMIKLVLESTYQTISNNIWYIS